jgi:thymidylate synthase (FAD)
MNIELMYVTPLVLVMDGIRTCWKTINKSDSERVGDVLGTADANLLRMIIKKDHTSTLEHSLVTYSVSGISRAVLQEVSRHRVGVSPSVESTRYTLGRLLAGARPESLIVRTGDVEFDEFLEMYMGAFQEYLQTHDLPNDVAKYGIPEAFKTNQILTFNFRSLRHFYKLRTSTRALAEIRELAHTLVNILPRKYQILFEDLK